MQFDEIISSGVHFLTEPIRVPSGTHLTAEQGCRLIGGVSLSGKYTMLENGVYVCDLKNTVSIQHALSHAVSDAPSRLPTVRCSSTASRCRSRGIRKRIF